MIITQSIGRNLCIVILGLTNGNSQDTYYTVSGWIYVENVPKNDAQVLLESQEKQVGLVVTIVQKQRKEAVGSIYQKRCWFLQMLEMNIRIDNNKKGKVWFDDVKIVKGNASQTVIVEESNYYPFGLKHKYNNVVNGMLIQKYGYNGKGVI